jgi:hypothetical protein
MKFKLMLGLLFVSCFAVAAVQADDLELKNGSLIKGRFVGATATEIKFQVGSSVQRYNIADVASVKFDDADRSASLAPAALRSDGSSEAPASVTIPAGTRISVRTIDSIDSTKNHVGDRFKASLEEPIAVDGQILVPKGADVYGRLEEAKTSGTFTGRSELRLALTGIVVDGQTVHVETGDYAVTGKSKGASTAKRSVGGAAVGTIIGAIAGGGKGAAIGAGSGAAVGAGAQAVTKGQVVKIPSETRLTFTVQQPVQL